MFRVFRNHIPNSKFQIPNSKFPRPCIRPADGQTLIVSDEVAAWQAVTAGHMVYLQSIEALTRAGGRSLASRRGLIGLASNDGTSESSHGGARRVVSGRPCRQS